MEQILHNPLGLLIVQMLLVIGLSRLIGRGAQFLGQPLVIAEIVAGILLGPSLLGWLAPDVLAAVFPASSLPALGLVSQLGLVLFMFLIGLELDPELLRGHGRSSVVISHASIVTPFALGGIAAYWLYPMLSEPEVPFTSFVLFLGVAMSITAFPVLARILTERRLLKTNVGAVAITCAAVDDVTAWCLLAFVVSVVRATGIEQALVTTVLSLGYIALMLGVVRPFLARLGARVANREGLTQTVVAITVLLVLCSALVTEAIGIHALFGAFLMGAVMPKNGALSRALAERLEDVVLIVLLPLFFAYSGLRTQIGLLSTPADWWMTGVIIAIATLGKFGGSMLAARWTGIGWRDSAGIGVLMNTRGLMELIVLNIGLDLGVISPTLFTMMVIMALVTTFVTTPILRLIYPHDFEALRETEPVAAVPAFRTLICVSHEGVGRAMVQLAHALQGGSTEPRTWALHLSRTELRASERMPATEREQTALEPVESWAREIGVGLRTLSFLSSNPSRDIVDVAEAKRADLVLLGWHKPLLGRTTLGGTVHAVMSESPADVGVMIDRGLGQIRRVLVPYAGEPDDVAALAIGRRIHGASLTVLLADGAALQGEVDAEIRHVGKRSDEQAVLDEAAQGFDLVICGAEERWGLEARPFGLQSERLVRECPASLLIIHRGHGPAAAAEPVRSPVAVV
jgi:Kef-type K+ transport system membrane component KefB/nucleotide-binding universal stress UspA family protein